MVAPQSTSFWIEDGPRFAPLIREIIRELVRRYPVDRDRIYVAGCSNGGYMSLKMTSVYPDLFAASVPICGVVDAARAGRPDADHRRRAGGIDTPTWLVASRDDTTVPPEPNTVHAHDLIPGSLITLYDHVIWNGYQFPGHWSWIYVARNDPSIDGTHIWQWMARGSGADRRRRWPPPPRCRRARRPGGRFAPSVVACGSQPLIPFRTST